METRNQNPTGFITRIVAALRRAASTFLRRAARGDDAYDDCVDAALNLPAWNACAWTTEGLVRCQSGALIVSDPIEFPSAHPSAGLVIEHVPAGEHRLELQRWNVRGYGRRVLRARILWGELGSPRLIQLGTVGVDLGAISVADAGVTAAISDDELDEAGFDPAGLVIGDVDYDCIDPLDGDNAFLHVFESGFGDGTYPVYRIDSAGHSRGILIDMTGVPATDV